MSLEVSTSKMEDGGPERTTSRRITDWVNLNYLREKTKKSFFIALNIWLKYVYEGEDVASKRVGHRLWKEEEELKIEAEKRITEIEDGIEKYFSELDGRDFLDDYKRFIHWQKKEGYANLTIRGRSNTVKLFFHRQKDPRCKIDDEDWAQMKGGLIPKSTRASTQDDILTKEQLKIVLQHGSIHLNAMVLFLLSSGMRVGAAVQLLMSDIDLYKDPPEVVIPHEITKFQTGGRVMWFSEEAREAIILWHKVRAFKTVKPAGQGVYDKDLVFNYTKGNFAMLWNKALAKADGKDNPVVLAKKDYSTKSDVHIYHVHTLRKFFRTNMAVEGTHKGLSGVPTDIVDAWLGRKAYLGEYVRLGRKRMAEIYKENMHVVTIHDVSMGEKATKRYKEMEEISRNLAKRTKELEDQTKIDSSFVDFIGGQLDIPEIASAVNLEDKKNIIIQNITQKKSELAQLKRDLVSARE